MTVPQQKGSLSGTLLPRAGTLAEYEARMREQTLIFPNLKEAEHDGFPPVAEVFDANPTISQHQLWLAYWVRHVELFDQHPTILPALMCRVYRMYPSLVREHHLYLLLEERGGYDLVIRTRKLDAAGVDYLVLQGGHLYSLAAFVDTPRSRGFRAIKQRRHPVFGTQIELPLRLDQADQVGPFAVYGERHVAEIWNVINQRKAA